MSISPRHWAVAFGLAALLHGAVFALAARTGDDMERGQGTPANELGTAMLSLDGESDLLQKLAPQQDAPVQEPVDSTSDQDVVEPVSDTPVNDEDVPEIEPIAERNVALAVPVDALTKPVEMKTEPKKDNNKKRAEQNRKKKQNRTASVRKGGGSNGRKANVSGVAAFSSYSGRVRARVLGRARGPGQKGVVVVRFTVTASGGVSSAKVVRGSSGALNGAALRAVRGGFPPIPPGLPRSISFTLPIRFN